MFFKKKNFIEYLTPAGEAWELTCCPISKKELKNELKFISSRIKYESKQGHTDCDLMFDNPKTREFIKKILINRGYTICSEWESFSTYKMHISWRILENANRY